jgi:hypothetical protein
MHVGVSNYGFLPRPGSRAPPCSVLPDFFL